MAIRRSLGAASSLALVTLTILQPTTSRLGAQAPPVVTIDTLTIHESGGLGTQVDLNVVVRLSAASTQTVTVTLTTTSRTASGANTCGGGEDFLIRTQTISIGPGGRQRNAPIMVCGDNNIEPDETFAVVMSNPINATIGGEGTVRILDDDQVHVRTNSNTGPIIEGNAGAQNVAVMIDIDDAHLQTITVQYATADSSATAGTQCTGNADYVSTSGTLTFQPGERSKTILVSVCGDAAVEPRQETFFLVLSNPTNALFPSPGGAPPYDGRKNRITIADDDRPLFSVTSATVPERNSGSSVAQVAITLSRPMTQPVIVGYGTTASLGVFNTLAAGGESCTGPRDFVTVSSATITFNPGETSKTVPITICGDATIERDENFNVHLTNPTNADIEPPRAGTITITNDDYPNISFFDATATLSTSTTTVDAVFTLTLSAAALDPVSVEYATADGSYDGGVACGTRAVNYITKRGVLSFPAGSSQQTIAVKVCSMSGAGSSDAFTLNLSNPTKVIITDATAVAHISRAP